MIKVAFIGVIADSKNEVQIKRTLDNRLNAKAKEHTVIIINDKSIDNIRNIRFETILVMTLEEIKNNKESINELFTNTKYLVLNADIENDSLDIINNMKLNVITFGFNPKATITASSVEESLMICIQRRIVDVNKNILEPQEISVNIMNKKLINNTHNSMGIVSILLIYGKKDIFF